jgi:DNA-binding IclR family transcriptional regulator
MGCINPDGTLIPSASKLLRALQNPTTPEEAARLTDLPLYRVRSSMREFLRAGLVEEKDGTYVVTAAGKVRIAGQS